MLVHQRATREKCTLVLQSSPSPHKSNTNPPSTSTYQNFPNTLARPGAPSSMPTPSCIATLTGRMGAESNTCGHGCDSGAGFKRGCSSSRSYIDGCRGARPSSLYCGSSNAFRAVRRRLRICGADGRDQSVRMKDRDDAMDRRASRRTKGDDHPESVLDSSDRFVLCVVARTTC